LKVAEQLFAFFVMLEFDDDEELMMMMMMHVHHCLNVVRFLSLLDNLLMEITPDQVIPRLVPANRNRTFDLLHPGWCYEKTRFRVAQLRELYHLLEFPVMFTLSENSHFASSEEAFIITLTKLATGDSNVVLADCFGCSGDGMVSLIYRYTIGELDNKARGLLHGDAGCLRRWLHLFPDFSEMIRSKLNMPQYGGLAFESCRLIGFLDCKFNETCAPGSGPVTDEELADRWEGADLIQEALYSGYVKAHGIKVLTVLFPNGITGYLYGPISGRENDIAVLNMSWLNHQLLLLQEDVTEALANGEAAVYFSLFSDSIFPYHLCITHKHEPPLGGILHERLVAENKATNSIRTSIEWTYGDVIVLFHVLHETYQKKYFLPDRTINEVLHQQLRVVFFIYKCYVCFNGNKLTRFFDSPPPKLSNCLAR
jgi:hypothetical protein